MVQLITLTLLKVFFKLLQEFIVVPDRSHWKMPRITCLSIPITTGNIPCSSFFPACSSPTCYVVCRESTLWIYTIPAARESFCSVRIIDVDSMSLEFLTSGRQSTAAFHTGRQEGSPAPSPCVYNRSTCVWSLPESTGSWSLLLELTGAQSNSRH